jgi:hypothetical protein
MGTCVELLMADSSAYASSVTTIGNFAICHWMYTIYDGTDDSTGKTTDGVTAASAWGETRYLNAADWGTAGATIVGTSMQSLGTVITNSKQGFLLSSSTLDTYVAGNIYSQSWYQPKYAETYTTT